MVVRKRHLETYPTVRSRYVAHGHPWRSHSPHSSLHVSFQVHPPHLGVAVHFRVHPLDLGIVVCFWRESVHIALVFWETVHARFVLIGAGPTLDDVATNATWNT
jgi:hypothetical protein